MSQQEALDLLKRKRRSKKWLTISEIEKFLPCGRTSVTNSLKKLREGNFIDFKYVKLNERYQYLYHYSKKKPKDDQDY